MDPSFTATPRLAVATGKDSMQFGSPDISVCQIGPRPDYNNAFQSRHNPSLQSSSVPPDDTSAKVTPVTPNSA